MLQSILELLKHANGETESIRIAQGKYKLPENFKDGWNLLKKEVKWIKK
jgi:hypothetical protein